MLLCQLTLLFLLAPRGEQIEAPAIRLELQEDFILASAVLPHGTYDVEWTGKDIVFTATSTLEEVLRISARAKPSGSNTRLALLTTDKKSQVSTLSIHTGEEEVTLTGKLGGSPREAVAPASLPASAPVETQDPVRLMWAQRVWKLIAHCTERAAHWTLAKYDKCVCPVVAKVLMPARPGSYRLPLDTQYQVLLDINDKGAVKSCAVSK